MFGIIYKKGDMLLPITNDGNSGIREFLTYDEADAYANYLEAGQGLEIGSKYRVISLEDVGV